MSENEGKKFIYFLARRQIKDRDNLFRNPKQSRQAHQNKSSSHPFIVVDQCETSSLNVVESINHFQNKGYDDQRDFESDT